MYKDEAAFAGSLSQRKRDILRRVNGEGVGTTEELDALLAKGSAPWSLTIERDGKSLDWEGG